jgi:hypothetical protein
MRAYGEREGQQAGDEERGRERERKGKRTRGNLAWLLFFPMLVSDCLVKWKKREKREEMKVSEKEGRSPSSHLECCCCLF